MTIDTRIGYEYHIWVDQYIPYTSLLIEVILVALQKIFLPVNVANMALPINNIDENIAFITIVAEAFIG